MTEHWKRCQVSPRSDDLRCAAFELLESGSEATFSSSLSCEDIQPELLGPLAAIICARP